MTPYEQGQSAYSENPLEYKNPFPENTEDAKEFERGWNDAEFRAKVDGGYFDE